MAKRKYKIKVSQSLYPDRRLLGHQTVEMDTWPHLGHNRVVKPLTMARTTSVFRL